ncbi:phage neck terminator protein [Francisella marina]|uniref:Phage neck terminator protein gp12-like domain-containing protein n=1 Tax=Francisella marina TaxID=2249302 RepID=A0ABX5ZK30_9GAMM|nr:hypothetical protein [Francisella marina]QEO57563.1 hypothetical protein F0R74_06745 [Francisella marina]
MIDIHDSIWELVSELNPTYSTDAIALTRSNFDALSSHNDKFIIIDIANNQRLAEELKYDKDNEKQHHCIRYKADVILDFYGNGAIHDINQFAILLKSHVGLAVSSRLGITCSRVNTPQKLDFKYENQSKWFERYNCVFKVQYNYILEVDTNRIDILNLDFVQN